ncbi:hypothetical protein CLOM_g20679 [Closterium sp. NIES-68]|nr:hypothetical protein CLOM_g20679 [Closterium sp. NIES-68]GJP78411.1 hypothetical protein CLOP_g8710 [Closterium sp. NIES-67]
MAFFSAPSSLSRSARRSLAPWIPGEVFRWKSPWLIAAVLLLLNSACPTFSYDYQQHQQQQYGQHQHYDQQQQYYQQEQQQQQQQQGAGGYRAVLLEDVKALTLRKGAMTTARRVAPVPQLSCIAGCDFQPDVVQCVNVGSDGVAVQWRCEAELPSHLKFGLTQVSCEGFDYPDDPRILHGSCGLQYSLVPVPGAQKKEKSKGWFKQQKQHFHHHQQQRPEQEEGSWLGRLLTWAIITYIAILALRSCCCGTTRPSGRGPAAGQAGSFSPPPPSPPPPPPPGSDDPWGGPKGSTGFAATAPPPPQPVPTWASAATGFGLGYLFGRRRTAAPPYQQQHRQGYYDAPRAPNPWPRTDSGGSSGSGSRGEDTHTATAYASTSRR